MNIFIFHRDFRIDDNTALNALIKKNSNVILLFIMTKVQTDNKGDYFSPRGFQAMIYCLKKLNQQKHLNILEAENETAAIESLINQGLKIANIYTNKDLSAFAWKRSMKMFELARKNNFIYREFDDYLLHNYDLIKTSDHNFYQVFTPYFNKIISNQKEINVEKCLPFKALRLRTKMSLELNNYPSDNFGLPLTRSEVFSTISNLPLDYEQRRNFLYDSHATSHLSAAIKFGVVSIREIHHLVWKKFGTFNNAFTRQLLWRDFFYQATFNAFLQKKWIFGQNWLRKMNSFPWINNHALLEKWKTGQTGFQIVDAAMHELNLFGTMHNRARLIVASFLVKNLKIDWREGEKYFAQKLIDYDPIVNQCSWQWVAGTGFDAQPFIRIFNPEIQQKKFDPEKKYIKQFLPNDLQNIPPIIDYKDSVKSAIKIYSNFK